MEMKKYRLADIAEIVISSVDKKTKPGEKIVRLCNFTDVYHNWAIKQSDYDSFMVASASDSNINKLSLKKGFVAFTKDSETRDDIGISTYIADDFDDVVLGYHCALAKPNEKIVYGKYLNAFMSSDYIKKYFELNATGSGMRFTLAVSTMEDMPIMLPSLNVQKKIGDMLSDFDKRIENLRAQNRVLEQTAKTIYDYTFLQCAGHQITYNKTLNRNIPAEWEVKEFQNICNIKRGASPRPIDDYMDPTNQGMPWVKISDASKDGSPFMLDVKESIIKDGVSKSVTVTPGTLIVSNSASPGIPKFIQLTACVHDGWLVLDKYDESFKYYLFYVILDMRENLLHIASGSVFKNLKTDYLKQLPVLIPDSKTMENFNAKIKPLFEKQLVNAKQIESLTTQRNTLLPLLITGQIEV